MARLADDVRLRSRFQPLSKYSFEPIRYCLNLRADMQRRGLIEILLKPSIDLRKLAIEELSKNSNSDLLLPFSLASRADLDQVYQTVR